MWLERFIIVVTSLHRDFLTSSWGMYYPTIWDIGLFVGTLGFFVFMMLLFIRFLPMISVFEMRELVSRKFGGAAAHHESSATLASAPATVEEAR
jgi:molybdopterin-containing oxidoreductase family membrane subunit